MSVTVGSSAPTSGQKAEFRQAFGAVGAVVDGGGVTTGLVGPGGEALATPVTTAQLSAQLAGLGASGYRHLAPKLTRWNAAKVRGAANPAKVMWYGDSNVACEGAGTGAAGLNGAALLGFASQFAQLSGYNYASVFGDQNTRAAGVTPGVYDPRLAMGSAWVADSAPSTFGGCFLTAPPGASGQMVFTPGIVFDRLTIYAPRASSGTTGMGVYIDGQLIDTLSLNGPDAFITKTYPTTSGLHTVAFAAGASQTSWVAGIVPWSSAAGVPINLRGGWCAASSYDLNATSQPWSPLNAAKALSPDFASVYLTINDATASVALGAYRANIEAIVSSLALTADGCLMVGYPGASANTTGGLLDDYATALIQIANDYGWGFYDSRRVFGGSNARASSKGYRFDNDHPNLSGHVAVATDYRNFLIANGF